MGYIGKSEEGGTNCLVVSSAGTPVHAPVTAVHKDGTHKHTPVLEVFQAKLLLSTVLYLIPGLLFSRCNWHPLWNKDLELTVKHRLSFLALTFMCPPGHSALLHSFIRSRDKAVVLNRGCTVELPRAFKSIPMLRSL